MEMRHEVVRHGERDVVVVSFSGVIAKDAAGDEDAEAGHRYVEGLLTHEHRGLILDLTELEYSSGNYVGMWFQPAWMRPVVRIRIVATGETADALMRLFENSGLEPVLGEPMLHASVAAALESLDTAEPEPEVEPGSSGSCS